MGDRCERLERLIAQLKAELKAGKETEKSLRENVRRVRAIFDQTFQYIGLLTPEGIVVEVNQPPLRFAGVKKEAVLGKPFWEIPWWRQSDMSQDQIKSAIAAAAKGKFIRSEVWIRARDGTPLCLDFSLKPVRNETGEIAFLIPEGRDITEMKRAEEALRESESRLQSILDNSPTAIYLKDTQGHYRLMDRNKRGTFSCPARPFSGQDRLRCVSGEGSRELDQQ